MSSTGGKSIRFPITIFIGAFLLFQVQPMIAKIILPWYGGTPAVWTTCMLFFQLFLFAGYTYAHLVYSAKSPKTQAYIHLGMTVLSTAFAVFVGLYPDESWKPSGNEEPTFAILLLLSVHVGLPYLVLASTSPLIQGWVTYFPEGKTPYRLYALSNAASLLALLSYPFAVEPYVTTAKQAQSWTILFTLFAISSAACCLQVIAHASGDRAGDGVESIRDEQDTLSDKIPFPLLVALWFLLPATGTMLLLAFTNHVCHDIASVPLLWVVPLSLYLLTFILCFDSDAWYERGRFAIPFAAIFCVLIEPNFGELFIGASTDVEFAIGTSLLLLFLGCMICHGELVKLRPRKPQHITAFYLVLSAGGAAGGLIVSVLAPSLFHSYLELPLSMISVFLLLACILFYEYRERLSQAQEGLAMVGGGAAMGLLCFLALTSEALNVGRLNSYVVDQERNFYGVLRVTESRPEDPRDVVLAQTHGRVLHGTQFKHPERKNQITSYYGPQSGAGIAVKMLPESKQHKIAVLGLGIGTIAGYGRAGDEIRFYEINPAVIWSAETHFSVMKDSPAEVDVVLGDARISLEREEPRNYDLLALDVFSGDAIPTHLLTKEAFAVYLKHLAPDGLLIGNITNRHLNLKPIVAALAEEFNLHGVLVKSKKDADRLITGASWFILSRDKALLEHELLREADKTPIEETSDHRILWTDNYSSIIHLL